MIILGIAAVLFISGCISSPATVIVCESDSECGTDTYSQTYCDGNIAKHDRITFTCDSPGTEQSRCNQSDTPETIDECEEKYYKCENGECLEKICNELDGTVWFGSSMTSRIFFDTPNQRDYLKINVLETGATFKVHVFLDKDGLPERRIFSSPVLDDDSINQFGWVKIDFSSTETTPSGYYWISIEVIEIGDFSFNTCVFNDREDDTYGREDVIINGTFTEGFDDDRINTHDMIYYFV